MPKMYFALKLMPRRSTFMTDMTNDERNTMIKHVAYWTDLMNEGKALVFGPVLDPNGGYGLGIIRVDSEEEVKQLMAADPANGLNIYEWFPMNAITPDNRPL